MVFEAEKSESEDEKAASRISAKNGLESYAYSLRNTLKDEKVTDWLDASQEASKEEYEEKKKELEVVSNPIITKRCQAIGEAPGSFLGAAPPGGFPDGDKNELTVKELD
ncbi:Hsp70 chaperone [Basidiobolus ranarum]|uniref:Hsp70 chaperone n=1 Tax=Basidiobolus ranarum TaxID=34480 RepID=A0ABR2VMS0_9FUNG